MAPKAGVESAAPAASAANASAASAETKKAPAASAAAAAAASPEVKKGYEAPAAPAAPAEKAPKKAVGDAMETSSNAGSTAGSAAGSEGSAKKRSGDSKTRKKGGKHEKTAEEKEAERKQKEVLKLISDTYTLANKRNRDGEGDSDDEDAAAKAAAAAKAKAKAKAAAKSSGWGSMFGKKKDESADQEGESAGKAATMGTGGNKVPDTFESMIRFNANMTGANMAFTEIMLRNFSQLISDLCYIGSFQEQTDFLALEVRKECGGDVKTNEFRAVLMTSLAALLPRKWDTSCEQAWGWFWDSLQAQLLDSLKHAKVHEQQVKKYIHGLQKIDFDAIGEILWEKLFRQEKEAELRHKQPTQTFIRISTLALQFTAKIFEDPYSMKGDITNHALKHILHQVDVRHFGVFVILMEDEIRYFSHDEAVTAGVIWALSVIASLMARTIKQASNPVLEAAVRNDVKGLKKALGQVGRKDRTQAALVA